MSDNPTHVDVQETPRPGSVSFGTWTAVIFIGHAVGMAILVGLAGVILSMPARRLLVPYTILICCGWVLSPLLYWARESRERPKRCAIRLGVAVFLYLQVLMLALGLGTIRLGLLSPAAVLNDYAPFMIPFTALASALVYFVTRKMLEAPQS